MTKNILFLLDAVLLGAVGMATFTNPSEETPEAAIIRQERAALNRWGKGDPMGFVEIAAPEITYFDPNLDQRIDGRENFTRYMEGIRGLIHVDRYELINPKVEINGDMAVLSFNYISWSGDRESRWNSSEVYRQIKGQWRIVHSHWSKSKPTK